MRVAIAGLMAGIALFIWGALAHTVLPLGEVGVKPPSNEDVVLSALREGLPAAGVYILPYVDAQQMSDEAAMKTWVSKSLANPYAMVIYQPQGRDNSQMGSLLGVQLGTDMLSGFALAWVLSLLTAGFGQRVCASMLIGLMGWLAISAPYANWYRFPMDATLALMVEELVGFLIAGLVAARWLGRKEARR